MKLLANRNLLFTFFTFFLFSFPVLGVSEAGEWEREYYDIVKRVERAAGIAIRIKILPYQDIESYIYPDGVIVFTEGMLKVVHNDDEFAFILAHEVSHLKQKGIKDEIPFGFLSEAPFFPNWLKIEIAADIFAVQLMAKAGYSPDAALTVFSRLNPKDIPSHTVRINALSKYLRGDLLNSIPNVWKSENDWEYNRDNFED